MASSPGLPCVAGKPKHSWLALNTPYDEGTNGTLLTTTNAGRSVLLRDLAINNVIDVLPLSTGEL